MKRLISAGLAAVLILSCTSEELIDIKSDVSEKETLSEEVDKSYAPGKTFVYFSDEMAELIESGLAAGNVQTKSAALGQKMEALGITHMERLFPDGGIYEARARKEGLHRWYIIKYSENIPHTRASITLEDLEGVEHIEPVRKIQTQEFNDLSVKLWGLNNTTNPGFDINVIPVWEQYTTGDPKVIVAVMDEGVDIEHEDLAANCMPKSYHYNAANPGTPITPGEHGTHVAGTIAAISNNGKGISGIAGGDYANGKKGVRIMSCQIFSDEGTTDNSSTANGFRFSADNGAIISQNSWGYSADKDGDGKISPDELKIAQSTTISGPDKDAIDYFIKYAGCDADGNQLPDSPMKGGIVIFAAGNDNIQYGAPADYEKVIAVGAVAENGEKSDFSNYGRWVDIAAPGTDIYSLIPDNQYKSNNGTSMACPHVSGVAALIVSQYGGPAFTNDMLKDRLLNSANKEKLSQSYRIGGLLDALGAMTYGEIVDVDPVTDFTATGRSNNIDMTWTAPKWKNPETGDEGVAYGYMIVYDDNKADVEAASPTDLSKVKYVTHVPKSSSVGKEVEYTMNKLDFSKTYHIKVYAYSYGLCYSEATDVMTVTTSTNNAPEITIENNNLSVTPYETIVVPVTIEEKDGHEFKVTYTSGSKADTFKQNMEGVWEITIVGYIPNPGKYSSTIKVVDEYGAEASMKFTYTILENKAPVKLQEIQDIPVPEKSKEFVINMQDYVDDPDGEPLKYEIIISNKRVLHISSKGNKLTGTVIGYGTTDVEIRAKDARGEYISLKFRVFIPSPSGTVSVSPSNVVDYLTIGTGVEPEKVRIRIISQTGRTLYDKTLTVSGYDPARIDMTSYAPGIYTVAVKYGNNEYKQTVVKL